MVSIITPAQRKLPELQRVLVYPCMVVCIAIERIVEYTLEFLSRFGMAITAYAGLVTLSLCSDQGTRTCTSQVLLLPVESGL